MRRRVALLALCATATAVALPATAAPARPVAGARATTRLAPGVTLWHDHFRNDRGRPERAVLVRARLGRHVTLQVRTPGQVIGLERATLSSMARRAGAVAGINGDFFDLTSNAAVPRGVVINGGRVLKSPRPNRLANLYVRADGHAAIGAIAYAYSITRPATTDRPAVTHAVYSINSLDDAVNDHLVYVDHDDAGGYLERGCVVVRGAASTVLSVAPAGSIARPAAGGWALAGCWGVADWLRANLRAGDRLNLSTRYPAGRPLVAIAGRRQLVRDGAAFDDPTGAPLSTWGRNPETFACVSRDGLTVLLGAIDGRRRDSVGVTYDQLTAYLLRLKCWSGLVLDGGGSTELVARRPGHRAVSVLNHPADGAERLIADALVVTTR